MLSAVVAENDVLKGAVISTSSTGIVTDMGFVTSATATVAGQCDDEVCNCEVTWWSRSNLRVLYANR